MSNTPPLTLCVMAAGLGSRYGGDKQIDGVGPRGEALMEYAVYDGVAAGFTELVLVIRPDMEAVFRERYGATLERAVQTTYVHQELADIPPPFVPPVGRTKPWGTGHAALAAAAAASGPMCIIGADDFFGRSALNASADFLRTSPDPDAPEECCIIVYRLANTMSRHGSVARAICVTDDSGYVTGLVEHTCIEWDGDRIVTRVTAPDGGPADVQELTGDEPVSMNVWACRPSMFAPLNDVFVDFLKDRGSEAGSEFYLPDAVNRLRSGSGVRIMAAPTDATWFGMTYHEDKDTVRQGIRELIDAGVYPEALWG